MPPPDRWEAYQALGSVIPETKFIAFKVPLKEEICRNLPENESFTPERLIQRIEESGKRLGLVVDLTFTRKYYKGQYFEKRDIQYEKIFTQGHEIPSDDVVRRFVEVVDDFSSKNTDENVVIGVHCTHGVNRTGYLVCRYMIENLKVDPDKAIALFGEARGHPIERENYLSDLKRRPFSSNTIASSWRDSDIRGDPDGQQMYNRPSHSWNRSQAPQRNSGDRGRGRGCPHSGHSSPKENFGGRECGRGHPQSGHSSPKENFGGRERGRGHPHAGHFSHRGDRHGESSPCMQGGASARGLSYSSPLEQFDAAAQSTWGNAARSGWGFSDSRGPSYGTQGFSRGRNTSCGSYRDYHSHRQNYSWRRSNESNSHTDSDKGRGYRDREENVRDRSHQKDFTGNRQGNRGRYRHQRNADDDSSQRGSGWGRGFSTYQGNSRGCNQYEHSGGYRGRGHRGGQMGHAQGGWNNEHEGSYNSYNWNS